jgi:hypothetical protein
MVNMDGQQFDRIARALGSGRSRRSVVKGLAAGVFGLVAGTKAMEQAAAGVQCISDGQACSPSGEGGSSCCEGYSCAAYVGDTYTCQAIVTCSWWGEDCTENECCDGFVCSSAGTCANEVGACAGGYERCEYQEGDVYVTCCDGLICEETGKGQLCLYCAPQGVSCEYDSCCSGLVCGEDLICAPPPVLCAAEGTSCAELACCDTLTCLDTAICGYPVGPEPKPEIPVVKLPDTGAGTNSNGSEWLIPAALGAAAAAVAGRKLLSSNEEAPDRA